MSSAAVRLVLRRSGRWGDLRPVPRTDAARLRRRQKDLTRKWTNQLRSDR